MELRGDRARLAGEEVGARHGLPRGKRRAGELLHEVGELPHAVEPEPRRDAVERLERERDLDEVRVAGPLPHAVHRPLHPGRPRLHRRDRRRRGEPEVVVPVPVDRDLVVEPLGDVAHEERRRLRGRDPERVHDDDLGRAGLDRGLVRARRKPRSARVESTPKKATRIPCSTAKETAERMRSSIVSRETPSAASFPSEIGLSITEALEPELDERLDVRLDGAREAPDLRLQAGLDDHPDRPRVVVGDAREPGLDAVDAGLGERRRDRELVLRREHDAHRLLAVAQGRVVEADRRVRLRLERVRVQVAGPHLRAVDGHAATIPSGKGESFSAPPAVIRKLSSTRSPPPPSI